MGMYLSLTSSKLSDTRLYPEPQLHKIEVAKASLWIRHLIDNADLLSSFWQNAVNNRLCQQFACRIYYGSSLSCASVCHLIIIIILEK